MGFVNTPPQSPLVFYMSKRVRTVTTFSHPRSTKRTTTTQSRRRRNRYNSSLIPPPGKGDDKMGTKEIGPQIDAVQQAAHTNVILLNGISQGEDINQRTFEDLTFKKAQLYVQPIQSIVPDGVANTEIPAISYRAALVMDKQPNGALPTYSDIFATLDPAGLSDDTLLPANIIHKSRFTILATKRWRSTPQANSLSDSHLNFEEEFPPLEFYFKKTWGTSYTGTSDGIGSISTGALLLVLIYEAETAAVPWPAELYGGFTYFSRVRFSKEN